MSDFDKIPMVHGMPRYNKLKSSKIIHFLQQLVTLLEAGYPIIQALDNMLESTDNSGLKHMVFSIKAQIYSGFTLAQSLKQYPSYFHNLHCHLIDVGEKTGTLTTVLMQIISEKQKNEVIKKNLKKALSYPTIVLIVSGLLTIGINTYIIPQFASLYASFAVELPLITQWIIQLSQLIHHFGLTILAFFAIVTLTIKYSSQRSSHFLYFVHLTYIKLPVIGNIISTTTIIRFTRTLAIALAAGMPIIDAMQLISKTIYNKVYIEAIEHASNEIKHGQSLYVALQKSQLFPPLSLQMIKIGENTGMMAKMLLKTADFYQQEIDDIISHMHHYLEPAITVILGLIVGTIVIAIYLPIFKLGSIF